VRNVSLARSHIPQPHQVRRHHFYAVPGETSPCQAWYIWYSEIGVNQKSGITWQNRAKRHNNPRRRSIFSGRPPNQKTTNGQPVSWPVLRTLGRAGQGYSRKNMTSSGIEAWHRPAANMRVVKILTTSELLRQTRAVSQF